MTLPAATAAVVVGDAVLHDELSRTLGAAGVDLVDPDALDPGHVAVTTLANARPPAPEDLGVPADARLVVVSREGPDHGPAMRRCLRLGVAGFVEHERVEAALAATVLAVAAGQSAAPLASAQEAAAPNLTTREKQVLGLVVMGLSNAEIASRLYVAESTVKSHLTTAFSKLGVRSRNHAVALILDPQSGLGTGILGIPR